MEITDVSLKAGNKLTNDYIKGEKQALSFFHYNIHEKDVYEKRLADVQKQSYPREQLAEYLLDFNKRYGASSKTIENIEKLKDPSSVVVVGGQQAGLLTGPLYTIHKVISIVLLAKQQEEALNVPVLPVFWIAGEDHDFAEINHVYTEHKNQLLKKTLKHSLKKKQMVSQIELDHEACRSWVRDVFQTFNETAHTNQVLHFVLEALDKSRTYVDFFAHLVTTMFAQSGLILMDAASKEVRSIESSFFVTLIEQNDKLSSAVMEQQTEIQKQYKRMIEVGEETAHLFYSHNENRVLLERDAEQEQFVGKQNELALSKEELVQIAKQTPELLSNNVVTRPLMQEYLLPTLAFIAGPGEVAYWAELEKAFSLFSFKMPPVVPRLSYAIVERHIEKYMDELQLDLSNVVNEGVDAEREHWLKTEVHNPYEMYFEKAKEDFEKIHKTLRENIQKEDKTFDEVMLKNRAIIQKQFETIQKIVESKQLIKHDVKHSKYAQIELALRPYNAPQERMWNIMYYLNGYGMQFVSDLLSAEVELNHQLKVCYV
ncbi:bacillithiol biosynthesis cysteine-adding enzyme BshC [Priestia megaterium]|uniref:Putative cysteine ligase BshC n=1 Tax=Priestia megaterium TaxID=1404 RepID=A0AA86I388_PRIMG|nr:bacillithiol biosynthesis cysteine-adding enzyme BshC [Priestia megaterium]AXI31160.1 bacillithiol biosynthesis cysteine-adding enzyme BshC [Priestia megaterium]